MSIHAEKGASPKACQQQGNTHHICDFCHTEYNPHSQVKRPRACAASICQRKRQRANEREWKQRTGLYQEAKSYRQKRSHRRESVQKVLVFFKVS